jgi:hypothetical protein
MKWVPCTVKVPPWTILLLPLNERPGASTVRPRTSKLRINRIGMLIAAMMKTALHPFGS